MALKREVTLSTICWHTGPPGPTIWRNENGTCVPSNTAGWPSGGTARRAIRARPGRRRPLARPSRLPAAGTGAEVAPISPDLPRISCALATLRHKEPDLQDCAHVGPRGLNRRGAPRAGGSGCFLRRDETKIGTAPTGSSWSASRRPGHVAGGVNPGLWRRDLRASGARPTKVRPIAPVF
jgi:hypothetical protein